MNEPFLELDEGSVVRYLESHFEHEGNRIDLNMTPEQHEVLFNRMREQWTGYGEVDPYTSVLSDEKYHMSRIAENLEEFNASGQKPIDWLLNLSARNDIKIPTGTCFELGCGVGRVTKPLAEIFQRVIAADISPGNLALCKAYLQNSLKTNVDAILLQSPHDIENIPAIDFFFSIIVLQHNPPPVQYYLLDKILQKINPQGACMFQTLTYNPAYAYNVSFQLSLDKALFEAWSIHCLQMRHIMHLLKKHEFSVIEVIEDGLSRGLSKKFHSHTFFATKDGLSNSNSEMPIV